MEGKNSTSNKMLYVNWAIKRLALMMYDALVVYFSYLLALVVRFYNIYSVNPVVEEYLPYFFRFAPGYTVACIVVFAVFRLYDSRWKHAGLNDLNRIFAANIVTILIQVAGSLLFVKRMPITYYVIGGTIQFCMIAASRLGYRLLVLERARFGHIKRASLNVMIVGDGTTARVVRRQIEHDPNNVARPVCVFSYRQSGIRSLMDGIPFVSGMEHLKESIKRYGVQCVILADSIMPPDIRSQIKDICRDAEVDVQDFSGYLVNEGRSLTLQKLMEYAFCPVEIMLEGKRRSFDNGEEALMAYPGKYDVKRLYVSDGKLGIEIQGKTVVPNDTNEAWVKEIEQETGKEISFF